jgi:hypothetical protein
MQRGWCDKAIFGREPYCRRAAWVWLIENAAFAPRNGLERGQIRTSFRFLAMAWRWSVPAIQRWLAAAQKAEMIRYTTDTACTIITVCNYSKYQLPIHLADTGPDTQPIHNRYTTDTPPDTNYKEGKKEERKEESVANATRRNDSFDLWWEGYPDKVGKGAAKRAFTKALTKTSIDQLTVGVERYKATKPVDRAWCHPATWLNEERWLDVPAINGSSANGSEWRSEFSFNVGPTEPPPPLEGGKVPVGRPH